MDNHTPTGSVSDRRGWEWNSIYGEDSDRESRHPRKFAPNRYRGESESGGESEQRQSELDRLRKEVRRQERHRHQLIQQYERCLAEKNRKLSERGRSDTSGSRLADREEALLDRLLETLQK